MSRYIKGDKMKNDIRRVILVDINTGDCVVKGGIKSIMRELEINDNNYKSIDKLKEHPKFKEKYLFFAFENDLLRYNLD